MDYETALKMLDEYITPTKGLYDLGHYMDYSFGAFVIILDDEFTVEELEAIVVYMKHNCK